MRGSIVVWGLLGAAVILVLWGAGLLLLTPVSFGWFAYAPLSRESFSSEIYLLTPERSAGAGLVILGMLIAVGVVGWVLGRRAGQRRQLPDPASE
jgi:heme/copper-type cytochrome/quinol oxidase subunit 1